MFKRILIGFLVLAIVLIVFYIAVTHLKPKQYKYLTKNGEFGISNNCLLDENQITFCVIDNSLKRVAQFYEI